MLIVDEFTDLDKFVDEFDLDYESFLCGWGHPDDIDNIDNNVT